MASNRIRPPQRHNHHGGGVKISREEIRLKFGGRCAYCGTEITLKQMHVDHVIPLYRGSSDGNLAGFPRLNIEARVRGTNSRENLFPACIPCNILKRDRTLEEFRIWILYEMQMLKDYDKGYRSCLRFERVIENWEPVVFHFERTTTNQEQG